MSASAKTIRQRQERQDGYARLRVTGKSRAQARAAIGISARTGADYEAAYLKSLESVEPPKTSGGEYVVAGEIIEKDGLLRLLSDAIVDAPPAYKSGLAAQIAKLQGWDVENNNVPHRPLKELMLLWSKEREQELRDMGMCPECGAIRVDTPKIEVRYPLKDYGL